MERELYSHDLGALPRFFWRLIGLWGIQGESWRFKWGELSFRRLGLGLKYSIHHEDATINLHLIWPAIYIKVPKLITDRPGTEDWNAAYGVNYHERAFQFYWRDKCKILHLPWDWQHVRHTYLKPDGSVHHHAGPSEYRPPEDTIEKHPYAYRLRSGGVQQRTASINGEEREWRWRWFTWLPFPPGRVKRSINIDFDAEVGERTGSWKGGCMGCGYDWRKGETMQEALKRMESERVFR
jgi:hypothetical protein